MMLPPGNMASGPCSGQHEHSILLAVLPYIEQTTIDNSFNFMIHFQLVQNSTAQIQGVSAIFCPSDPAVAVLRLLLLLLGEHLTSYKGNCGTTMSPGRYADPNCTTYNFSTQISQATGLFYFYSHVTMAAITDGTSNTMSLGEYAWGKTMNGGWGWWNSGNYGDTLFTSSYPMNPFNKSASEGTGQGINTGSD